MWTIPRAFQKAVTMTLLAGMPNLEGQSGSPICSKKPTVRWVSGVLWYVFRHSQGKNKTTRVKVCYLIKYCGKLVKIAIMNPCVVNGYEIEQKLIQIAIKQHQIFL